MIRVESVPDSKLKDPTDAVVRITHACLCGSDLWFSRGQETLGQPGFRIGHDGMGIIEEVGSEVQTVKPGDRVIAPFADGTLVVAPPELDGDERLLKAALPLTEVLVLA